MKMRLMVAAASVLLAVAACSKQEAAGAGQNAAAAGPVTLEMQNTPNPPVTGENTITIVAKQSDGSALTDATVKGEFFMPVMESMGKTTVEFTSEGGGRYTGRGVLSMAGSWQVTVTATRDGKTLATRTFNLTTKS
jgi:hypothetical protein